MKIANISPLKINYINRQLCNNEKHNTYIHTGICDSVNFTSKMVSAQKLQEIKAKSREIKENAVDILAESMDLKDKSYELLESAKEEYMLACNYINIAKKHICEGEYDLPNGNTLRFNFVLENDDDFYLHIKEYNLDNEPIREIAAESFRPSGISVIDEDDVHNMFDFNTNRILINHNVNQDDDGVMFADMMCIFDSGRLLSIKTDSSMTTEPISYDKYFYYLDDILATYSCDNITHEFGDSEQSERYNFVNGIVASYCLNFSSYEKGATAWDEGYYFKDGKLIGYSKANSQENFDKPVECESVISLNGQNKFVEESNIQFELDEDGVAKFKEN